VVVDLTATGLVAQPLGDQSALGDLPDLPIAEAFEMEAAEPFAKGFVAASRYASPTGDEATVIHVPPPSRLTCSGPTGLRPVSSENDIAVKRWGMTEGSE
jgi:hypothetical protein